MAKIKKENGNDKARNQLFHTEIAGDIQNFGDTASSMEEIIQLHKKIDQDSEWDIEDVSFLAVTPIIIKRNEKTTQIGTGVFVQWEKNIYLVTAKHVIWNMERECFCGTSMVFFMPRRITGSTKFSKRRVECTMNLENTFFCDHPTLDIIAFPHDKNRDSGRILFNKAEEPDVLSIPIMPREQRKNIVITDELIQMGYPKGIADEYLCSVCRKAFPCFPVAFDRHTNFDGAIDAFVYPGASGGPIVVRAQKPYQLNGVFYYYVLGLLSHGPHAPINPNDPNSQKYAINIGNYILMERLGDQNFLVTIEDTNVF